MEGASALLDPALNDGRSERPPTDAYTPRSDGLRQGEVVAPMTVDLFFAVLNLMVGLACLYLALRSGY